MSIALLLGILIVVFFVLSFLSRRRFGVLGLALATGALLSQFWAIPLAEYLESSGLSTGLLTMPSVTAILITIMPSTVLFMSGPAYTKPLSRMLGSLCFTVLLVTLLIEPLGNSFVLIGDNKVVYDWLFANREMVISAGLVLAVMDVLMIHSSKKYKKLSK